MPTEQVATIDVERDKREAWTEELERVLGWDRKRPEHRAAALMAQRYNLDPLLRHVVVIPGVGPYVTRDGYLALAHRSGVLDGIVVESEGENDWGWWSVVTIWRRDMSHAFTYRGRYPANGQNKKFGPDMAVARAERNALARAFPVLGAAVEDTHDTFDDIAKIEQAEVVEG
jgi:hypothetical protein